MVNWTMLTHMTAIWRKIYARIAPKLGGEKRWLFIDLADPAKRERADLAAALQQITRFQRYFRVILGMNLQESRQVGEVLGIKPPEENYEAVTRHAAMLRETLRIDTAVIHPTQFAAAADATAGNATHVVGPFTAKPKAHHRRRGSFQRRSVLPRPPLGTRTRLGTASRSSDLRLLRAPGKESALGGSDEVSAHPLKPLRASVSRSAASGKRGKA